jgi:hypothetical protein
MDILMPEMERPGGLVVGAARVFVADVGGEEFEEAIGRFRVAAGTMPASWHSMLPGRGGC